MVRPGVAAAKKAVVAATTVVVATSRVVAVAVAAVLLAAAPVSLQFLFLVYPLVTQHAFEAFSFHDFEQGSWLRADVRIQRGTPDHAAATTVANIAIGLYPVGLLLGFGALLLHVRAVILSGDTSRLREATAFLHGEYRELFYW